MSPAPVLVLAAALGLAPRPVVVPPAFEENCGQAPAEVRFLAREPGGALLVDAAGAVLVLDSGAALRLALDGAAAAADVVGLDPEPGRVNVLRGADPERWAIGAARYRRVVLREAAPCVDLELRHDGDGRLELVLDLAPGVDPDSVRLRLSPAGGLAHGPGGEVALELGGERVELAAPRVAAGEPGAPVEAAYVLRADGSLGFALGERAPGERLVIDPVITYSTRFGSAGFGFGNIRGVGAAPGRLCVAGMTDALDLPLQAAYQAAHAGGTYDGFVSCLDPDTNTLLYSTYLGGSGSDWLEDLEVDGSGVVTVVGHTDSSDFPVVSPHQGASGGADDAVVARFDAGGIPTWSTYLGGSSSDYGRGLALEPPGSVLVALTGVADAVRLDASGALVDTFTLPGSCSSAEDVAVDAAGSVFVVGSTSCGGLATPGAAQLSFAGLRDMLVTKFDASGRTVLWATYVGGSEYDAPSRARADAAGNLWIAGRSDSADYPTVNARQPFPGGGSDAVVTAVAADGASLVHSTYIGGEGADDGDAVEPLPSGAVAVAGLTRSKLFPVVRELQGFHRGGNEAFVTVLAPGGASWSYSTYLGGQGTDELHDLAVDPGGDLVVGGFTSSNDWPLVTPYAITGFGFLTRLHGALDVDMRGREETVTPGAPVTLDLGVESGLAGDALGVTSTIVFDPCIDVTAFDPVIVPGQVTASAPHTVQWTPATRTLVVTFTDPLAPADARSIALGGISAAGGGPLCCNGSTFTHQTEQNGFTADACFQVTTCAPLPEPARGLRAVRSGADVALSWDPPSDATAAFNVWKVVDGNERLIPRANAPTAQARPDKVERACSGPVPAASPSCVDRGAVSDFRARLYYQVRGACSDGSEGTDHPL